MFGALSLYAFTHPEKFQPILLIFAVILLLFGLIGMYYYETKYLRFNPDNTITYRGLTGKLRTTPIPAHLYFRCTQDRWADPNNPQDMQEITWAIEHYPRVIDFLTANPRITGMATGNIEPKPN